MLLHAMSTNGLEDLFPQSRASPSAQQSRASEFPWFSDTTQPLCWASSPSKQIRINPPQPSAIWPHSRTQNPAALNNHGVLKVPAQP